MGHWRLAKGRRGCAWGMGHAWGDLVWIPQGMGKIVRVLEQELI